MNRCLYLAATLPHALGLGRRWVRVARESRAQTLWASAGLCAALKRYAEREINLFWATRAA